MRAGCSGTVLVVDDEAGVCAALQRFLREEGYTAHTATTGEQALQILQQIPVDVIISDQHMPGLSGVDLLKIVRVRHPQVVRILLTGDAGPDVPVRSINESEVYRFIRKPWNHADLRTILAFAFEVARTEQEKRHLVTVTRNQRAPKDDPAELESELLRLAEEELQNR